MKRSNHKSGHFGGKTVDSYIAKAAPAAQRMMIKLRSAIRAGAPQAKEKMSYGIPFYEYRAPGYKGRLVYFGAFQRHVSLFVVPEKVGVTLAKKMKPYKAGRSTLQFPIGTTIPMPMIKQLIKIRIREIDAQLTGHKLRQTK